MQNKINWRSGEGEFIGFSITIVMLLYLLTMLVSFAILGNNLTALENCTTSTARKIVIAKNKEKALEIAKKDIKIQLKPYKRCTKVKTTITYLPGYNKWQKGQFAKLKVTSYIKAGNPFISSKHSSSVTFMIEKVSDEQIAASQGMFGGMEGSDFNTNVTGQNASVGDSSAEGLNEEFQCAKNIGESMRSSGFHYVRNANGSTFEGTKKGSRAYNCATYASWAWQAAGLLPSGKTFWFNNKMHGNAIPYIKAHPEKYTIIHPNKTTASCDLKPGDIVGMTYKGFPHTCIYAGKSAGGKNLYYSGGRNDDPNRMKNYGWIDRGTCYTIIRPAAKAS